MKIRNYFFLSFLCVVSFSTLAVGQVSDAHGDLPQAPNPLFSQNIPYSRVIAPFDVEVSYNQTVHIIFPSIIRYVDLGSASVIADKANSAENVLRVKANIENFTGNTSLSVITDDGAYYSFNLRYSPTPRMLSFEMGDILSERKMVTNPDNRTDIFFGELQGEAPALVKLYMRSIYENNERRLNSVGVVEQNVGFGLNGVYANNSLMYLHTYIRNNSNVPYRIDRVSFRIVDKIGGDQTAMQDVDLKPLRTYNYSSNIGARTQVRTVFCLETIAIPQDKMLEITCYELGGSRTLTFYVNSRVLSRASGVEGLTIRGRARN